MKTYLVLKFKNILIWLKNLTSFDFSRFLSLFATNKLRLSLYTYTASGNPRQAVAQFVRSESFFPIPIHSRICKVVSCHVFCDLTEKWLNFLYKGYRTSYIC